MSKRGENITKRKDGRWEARVIKGYNCSGKALYQYIYGRTYSEAKNKQMIILQDNQKSHIKKILSYFHLFFRSF